MAAKRGLVGSTARKPQDETSLNQSACRQASQAAMAKAQSASQQPPSASTESGQKGRALKHEKLQSTIAKGRRMGRELEADNRTSGDQPPIAPILTSGQLRAIINATADAILTVDSAGRILDFNPAAEAMFACSSTVIIGQPLESLFSTISAQLLRSHLCAEATNSTLDEQDLLIEGRRPDDDIFLAEVAVRPAADQDLFVFVVRDLSERRRLEHQLIELNTRQQQQVSREIHDDIAQQLSGILMLASNIERRLALPAKEPKLRQDFEQLQGHIKQTLDSARQLSKRLAPADLASDSLPAALSELAARVQQNFGLECRFRDHSGLSISDHTQSLHLFRIAQEAVSNAIHLGQATCIEIHLQTLDDSIRLSVRHNGRSPRGSADASGGLGLRVMRSRANILGGQCRFISPPGGGTLLQCDIPDWSSATSANPG
ncbi:PAS domain-containing sensor histidine kinase [Lamprobacter modestohalophilus]|nr:PAS domain-containing sensor histidine kinase [Lamprobacter modestohalophilus]